MKNNNFIEVSNICKTRTLSETGLQATDTKIGAESSLFCIAPDKRAACYFSYLSNENMLCFTHNICFYGGIRKMFILFGWKKHFIWSYASGMGIRR